MQTAKMSGIMISKSQKQPTLLKNIAFYQTYKTMIIIKPQNRSVFLENYDRPSMTPYPCSCFLYLVRGTSVGWSILDLTQACECNVALERYRMQQIIIIILTKLLSLLNILPLAFIELQKTLPTYNHMTQINHTSYSSHAINFNYRLRNNIL